MRIPLTDPQRRAEASVLAAAEVHRRLSDPDLARRAVALGFRDPDVVDLMNVVQAVLASDDDLATVTRLAGGVLNTIGYVGPEFERRKSDLPYSEDLGIGVLPMAALLVTAPEAAAFHASRGVPQDVSAATLTDFGQQVHVHRLTFGDFGLHTHWWVKLVWSGFLFRLGRLQFNLALEQPAGPPEWVLSTHIPMSGPLTPAAVDRSLAAATTFFARHFPDYPTRWFHCRSWLLDPALSERLPQSNLAAFQRRWTLYGEAEPGMEDVLFFVFFRRGQVDPGSLPTDTALRRLVVERLLNGQGWMVCDGKLPH